MTNEEYIRAGIIAGKELNVLPDAEIILAPDDSLFFVVRVNQFRKIFCL